MSLRLTTGSPAPAFVLPSADGTMISLADHAGGQVIVYFYPAAMTPDCTTQAIDFSKNIAAFTAAGYSVLGISPDPVERLARFSRDSSIAFPLLSDEERSTIKGFGAFGSKMIFGKEIHGVIRSTFIIDVSQEGQGTIRFAQYNVRATGHVAKLRRELGI